MVHRTLPVYNPHSIAIPTRGQPAQTEEDRSESLIHQCFLKNSPPLISCYRTHPLRRSGGHTGQPQ